jgi:hypothetical protein
MDMQVEAAKTQRNAVTVARWRIRSFGSGGRRPFDTRLGGGVGAGTLPEHHLMRAMLAVWPATA